jgi:hypothetical protein
LSTPSSDAYAAATTRRPFGAIAGWRRWRAAGSNAACGPLSPHVPFCSDSGSGTHRPWSTVVASGRFSNASVIPSRMIRCVSKNATKGRPPLLATCRMPEPSTFAM